MATGAKGVADGRALRVVLGGLAIAGLLISSYLTWVHFAGVTPVCAGGGHGCRTVQSSRYATILAVPVALLGVGGYAGLLLAAILRGQAGAYLGLLVALIGALFSAYLTYLEIFVIGAICQWCVASAAIMAGALVCAALPGREPADEPVVIRTASRFLPVLAPRRRCAVCGRVCPLAKARAALPGGSHGPVARESELPASVTRRVGTRSAS